MVQTKRQTRLLAALALIVAITLVGLLGVQMINAMGRMLPPIVGDVILLAMWWGSFILMLYCIKEYYQILHNKKKKDIQFQVVCLLGMVVAISHVGNLGITGGSIVSIHLLPTWLGKLILHAIFWIAFFFVFEAVRLYRKI